MLAVFDDTAAIRYALAFESALVQAEAAAGLITPAIAMEIKQACDALDLDPAGLADEAALAGTLAIPLVKRLRHFLDGAAAAAVHRGTTSQDLADTVLMLQAKAAEQLLQADLTRITGALTVLARRHATTPAIGRTLLQDALPIGFGLRIAHWRAGVADAARRLSTESSANLMLQFGGPAGSRAGLGGQGQTIAAHMGRALGLPAEAPWQARRGGIAAVGASLGILIGALGKMARDVSLLAQNAIGEAREPSIPGRGGSSAMAHKRNPTGCQVALSAAIRAPGLVSAILSAMPQEEERGLGGWQSEGPMLADLFLLAAGSAAAMATVAEGLEIDGAAIARNLVASGLETDIGESEAIVAELLAPPRSDR